MGHEQHRALEYGEHSVFIETLAPPPDLLIFGAVHIGQALASFGTQMGYRVTVVDSRAPFVTEERFPTAHRLLVGWPRDLIDQLTFDRRTWVAVLSHDPRHETPPLQAALRADTRYIGAMGSRRTLSRGGALTDSVRGGRNCGSSPSASTSTETPEVRSPSWPK
jgi:xanthine dehydrogenase accessory factor